VGAWDLRADASEARYLDAMDAGERSGVSSGDRAAAHARRRAAARRRTVRRRRGVALAVVAATVSGVVLALALEGGSGAHTAAIRRGVGGGRAAVPVPVAHDATFFQGSAAMRRLIALGHPIYCAPVRGDEVALTFDDGPGPYTRLALAKLRKHHIHATFFIVGRNIGLVPGALSQERAIGAVGDHTWTHPVLTGLSAGAAEEEIVRTQQAVAAASGGPVALFRPPYGAHDASVDSIARMHGLLEILWNVDSADSLGANWAQIERNVIAGLHPGSIILMHENHGQTIRAMLGIFAALERRHLHAVSVPQLLTDDPPSNAQVLAGGSGCGIAGGVKGD
jgi:peptidoglycan-N-acetylglucosamine deacetylase